MEIMRVLLFLLSSGLSRGPGHFCQRSVFNVSLPTLATDKTDWPLAINECASYESTFWCTNYPFLLTLRRPRRLLPAVNCQCQSADADH